PLASPLPPRATSGVAPGAAEPALRTAAAAPAEQRAGARDTALRAAPGAVAEVRARGRCAGLLLPSHRSRTPAQAAERWPTRVRGNEGRIAREVRVVVVAAQDRPFDELARHRVADRALLLGRFRSFALPGKPNRGFDVRDVDARGGSGIGGEEGARRLRRLRGLVFALLVLAFPGRGLARLGVARLGSARRGGARLGSARLGGARLGGLGCFCILAGGGLLGLGRGWSLGIRGRTKREQGQREAG